MSIDITKYVLAGGVVCPFCGEDAVASNKPVQQTADLCWVSCRCANCESDWAWDFELVGIEVDGESHRGVPPLKDYARIERLKEALRGVLEAWDRIGLCTECGGEGVVDSGGVTQWDQPINVPCGCSVFSKARAALAEGGESDGR